jgi:hypothetical protein
LSLTLIIGGGSKLHSRVLNSHLGQKEHVAGFSNKLGGDPFIGKKWDLAPQSEGGCTEITQSYMGGADS